MTKMEKFMIISAAIFAAIFFVLTVTHVQVDGERDSCREFCKLRNREIRLYEPGLCICQQ